MPVIKSEYQEQPFYLFNGHLQTIIPSLFRNVKNIDYTREEIATPDQDFLHLDWKKIGSDTLAILSHGLEGDAARPYMKGMVKAMNEAGFDALAWNYRSCSGQPNKLLRSYHSGATDDLETVINHALKIGQYKTVFLLGFSMGGNITLKYIGEQGEKIKPEIKKAVVFSVPCHLSSSAKNLARRGNRIYLNRFLKSLRQKLTDKAALLPGQIDLTDYNKLTSFHQFDDRFTAPMHGFKDAEDYYQQSSSIYYLNGIRIPTLIVNALNDPFLAKECYPVKEAEASQFIFLEMPESGGHVGFAERFFEQLYYSERRAIAFLTSDFATAG